MKARTDLAQSDLGAVGADAIRQALEDQGVAKVPAVRTINRILGRRGALDGKKRTRRPPPPTGWYLPDVAAGRAELDSIDIVEGLVIKDGPQVEVLNGVSLHGGLVASWSRGFFIRLLVFAFAAAIVCILRLSASRRESVSR